MSDHPVAGRGIGGFQCQVGAHGGAERADAVLDMRGARAFGGRFAVDDIGRVDAAGAFLGGEGRFAMLADIGGVLDVQRPVAAGPPGNEPGLQIIAREQFHTRFPVKAATPGAPRQSSASARAATLPTMMSAGLATSSRTTSSPRSVSRVRRTRASAVVPRSITATGRPGETPSAISLSAIALAVARPM